MAKTYLPNGAGAPFKNIIRFIGGKPLDGRTVVDTYSDISGDNYKALFTNEDNGSQIVSYYTGMLVVTKDTGKLYVLAADGLFKEVTPDLSNIYGSITATNYSEAKSLANANNIGQIIYVTSEETSTTEKDEEGNFIVYSVGPYIVTGAGSVAKLGTTTATGDLAGDVETLKGKVATLTNPLTNNDPIVLTTNEDLDGSNTEEILIGWNEETAKITNAEFINLPIEDKLRLVITNNSTVITFNNYDDTNATLVGTVGNYVVVARISGVGIHVNFIKVETAFGLATSQSVSESFEAVNKSISDLSEVVSKLPTFDVETYEPTADAPKPADPKADTLYLIKEEGAEGEDIYREWIYLNGAWESLGVHTLDITAINNALNDKVDKVTGKELIDSTLIPVITENQTAINDLLAVVGEEDLAHNDVYGETTPTSLISAVNIIAESTSNLISDAVLSVTGNDTYLTVSESNNVVTLTPVMCAVADATATSTGLADAYDVQQYVQGVKSNIEKALEWNDVE